MVLIRADGTEPPTRSSLCGSYFRRDGREDALLVTLFKIEKNLCTQCAEGDFFQVVLLWITSWLSSSVLLPQALSQHQQDRIKNKGQYTLSYVWISIFSFYMGFVCHFCLRLDGHGFTSLVSNSSVVTDTASASSQTPPDEFIS